MLTNLSLQYAFLKLDQTENLETPPKAASVALHMYRQIYIFIYYIYFILYIIYYKKVFWDVQGRTSDKVKKKHQH